MTTFPFLGHPTTRLCITAAIIYAGIYLYWFDVKLVDGVGDPRLEHLMYVHVGKTGGTTLDTAFRSNCVWYKKPRHKRECLKALLGAGNSSAAEPMVSSQTKATIHTFPRRGYYHWIKSIDTFLVSLRSPVSRAVSAFNYGHPRNGLIKLTDSRELMYEECFPTVEDLAQLLLAGMEPSENDLIAEETKCFRLGKEVLQGKRHPKFVEHLFFNYEFYGNFTFLEYPERKILGVRTTALWDDMANIEESLGGDSNLVHSIKRETHGSESFPVSSGLSRQGEFAFCCYLAHEIQIYQGLILRAENLLEIEKQDTLHAMYKQCNVGLPPEDSSEAMDWETWAKNTCFPVDSLQRL